MCRSANTSLFHIIGRDNRGPFAFRQKLSRRCVVQHSKIDLLMPASGLGCAKTKSDLKRNLIWSSCRAEEEFLYFFALNVTTRLKISGAIIPRNVFTQPGSKPEFSLLGCM